MSHSTDYLWPRRLKFSSFPQIVKWSSSHDSTVKKKASFFTVSHSSQYMFNTVTISLSTVHTVFKLSNYLYYMVYRTLLNNCFSFTFFTFIFFIYFCVFLIFLFPFLLHLTPPQSTAHLRKSKDIGKIEKA